MAKFKVTSKVDFQKGKGPVEHITYVQSAEDERDAEYQNKLYWIEDRSEVDFYHTIKVEKM